MLPRAITDRAITLASRTLGLARRRAGAPVLLPPRSRIAFLKPCCLGDVIMATAAVGAVRRSYPEAHLTFITGPWSREAVAGNPSLDATLLWDWSPEGRVADLQRLVKLLRSERYDAVLVLDRSPLLGLAARMAGVPIRAGMDSDGRGFSLTHPAPTTPGRHEALLYLDVAAQLQVDIRNSQLEVMPSAEDIAWAKGHLGNGDWVALHSGGGANPGSTLIAKRWPAERFAELSVRLRNAGHPMLLAGGPEEPGLPIASGLTESAAPVLDLTGQTTIGQLGALLSLCRLFAGNDTGPMHLAVAVGTPVVAVFGPSKPSWYRPFTDVARVIYHGEACRECSFRGGLVSHCANDFRCMDLASVDEVWKACCELLDRTGVPVESATDAVP